VEYFERNVGGLVLCLQGELRPISRRAFMPDVCEQAVNSTKRCLLRLEPLIAPALLGGERVAISVLSVHDS
jgi:hypothetical protein